uniref:Uncharacterized protein n=1 Tax=Oryza punctata TaxID=4537 RepID=A0A0E0M618_ORYPU
MNAREQCDLIFVLPLCGWLGGLSAIFSGAEPGDLSANCSGAEVGLSRFGPVPPEQASLACWPGGPQRHFPWR